MFTIPHFASSIEYPSGSGKYPQSRIDKVDLDILLEGVQRRGVRGTADCAITQRAAGANQSVDFAGGTIVYNDIEIPVVAGNVAAAAAHASLPRFDLAHVSNAAVKAITAGTPATDPVFPALPANVVACAVMLRRPSDDIIETAEIVDKRVLVPAPPTVGITRVPKMSDELVNNSATLQNDNHLFFPITATSGQVFPFEIVIFCVYANASSTGFRVGFSVPAGATMGWQIVSDSGTPSSGNIGGRQTTLLGAGSVLASLKGGGAGNAQAMMFKGRVVSGGTAGNVNFQWAQDQAHASDNTFQRGSYLDWSAV